MLVICYKYTLLLHTACLLVLNCGGTTGALYQEIKDVILQERNILIISIFFNSIENVLYLLCTNIHFYVHHNILSFYAK